MDIFLLLLALSGHAFLWIGLVNRLHALGLRRRIIGRLTLVFLACAAILPIPVACWFYGGFSDARVGAMVAAYVVLCWIIAPLTLLRLAWLRLFWHRTPSCVRFHGRRRMAIDLDAATAADEEITHHPLTRLPLNEILRLDLVDWTLDVPRLPQALDGLSIAHLSDLHFTGRVGKAYFREVVRVCNSLEPDLTVVTGDLIDERDCLSWIPDTFGRLVARHGVYFILGNHDLRTGDVAGLRRRLEQAGLVDLGGRRRRIEIAGQCVELLGSERPWIEHNDPSTASDFATTEPSLRIALAHSPDQFGWAKSQNADLFFVGHTHGGQIRLPLLGAIFSPSTEGVKHIAGLYNAPTTIMHVSRGISGDIPVRWRCAPEVARLKLRSPKS